MSVHNEPTFKSVESIDRRIQVRFEDGTVNSFEDCWLRDHCRCSTCYHADTNQRAIHILDIPDSRIVHMRFDKAEITITWDDKHESTYKADFLAQFDYHKWLEIRRHKPKLWAGAGVAKKVARVQAKDFLGSDSGARRVFQSLLDYGVALIEGVEPSLKGTEPVCQALGGVQHTLFGGMWEFTTHAVHADTAYTSLGLAAHNDNTYFTEAAGLQVLHCLEHKNGTGGENFLVDGFYGATQLKDDHPEDFEFMTKFNVEAEYLEENHNHRYSAPVIRINSDTKDLEQIRYNVYDRTAMAFECGEKCRSYYRSLRNLGKYYQDPSNQWQFKLNPGTVLVMDNFRVLHGRTAFTGSRVIGGSYVARSDWLDRARVLGLIG